MRFQSKVNSYMFQLSTKCDLKMGKQISLLIMSFDLIFKAIIHQNNINVVNIDDRNPNIA